MIHLFHEHSSENRNWHTLIFGVVRPAPCVERLPQEVGNRHAWNGYWETLAGATTGENTELVAYLTGESGIASIVMMSLVVLWLSRRAPAWRRLPAES